MSDEEEWWKENAEEYANRLDSLREGMDRIWNEGCYLTDEFNLTFNDVSLIMCEQGRQFKKLEIQEIEGISSYDDDDDDDDDDYYDDDEDDDEGESWKD